jgi:suppressor of ftsI
MCAAVDDGRSLRLVRAGVDLFATAATALCTLVTASGAPDAGRTAQQAAPPSSWTPVAGRPLRQPRELRSRDGVLKVELDARRQVIDVAGAPLEAQPFNGRLVGPTLRVRPGERLEVTIRNGTSERTNIHYHGLHVNPTGDADNVFRVFEPASTVRSVVELPRDHPPGTYWYHVHLHGSTEEQVMGGMSGLLIVDGLEQILPRRFRGIRERALALRDVQVDGGSIVMGQGEVAPDKPSTWLVNGQLRPTLSLAPGETQLWRIANIGADLFYDVALDDHRLSVVAEDGSPVWRTRTARHLVLPPGKRFDVLVQGGKPGRYGFRSRPYDEGFELLPAKRLATLTVGGKRRPRLALPRRLATPAPPIAGRPVTRRRTFTFAFGTGTAFTALINGKVFDPHAIGVTPRLGTVEEWTLRNPSSENHPFHIHVNDFQVMSVNGTPYRARGLQDVVVIPKNGGEVVIRNRFEDFTGHFVFHCHILGHEDAGMMQTVQVLGPGQRPTPPPGGDHAALHAAPG